MGVVSSNLIDAARAVHLFKINGYSATKAMAKTDSLPSKRLAVGGYEWEVHYTPCLVADGNYWIAFKLVLLGAPRQNDVKAALKCRLVDAQQRVAVSSARDANGVECQLSHAFKRAAESSGWLPLHRRSVLEASGSIKEDSFTVECTITVITEQQRDAAVGPVRLRFFAGAAATAAAAMFAFPFLAGCRSRPVRQQQRWGRLVSGMQPQPQPAKEAHVNTAVRYSTAAAVVACWLLERCSSQCSRSGRTTTHVLPRHTGSQSLCHDLGELLRKGTGSDVTLVVSGESFTAHKAILASRSPVFMAQLFGHMKEARLQRVEIKGMEAAEFRAMLRFIYTDMVPELDQPDGIIIAVQLLAAADMYGIDMLKSICEDKLCDCTSVETVRQQRQSWHWQSSTVVRSSRLDVLSSSLQTLMQSWRPRITSFSWQAPH